MSGHTPGPWAIEYVGDKPLHYQTDRPTVAYVGDYRVVRDGNGMRGYDGHGPDEKDARLVAAAPGMLAALHEAANLLNSTEIYAAYPVAAVRISIEDAISKAEVQS